MTQYVFSFDEDHPADPELLGGKGAGLVEMTRLGLPVPPGFTLSTQACRYFMEHQVSPPELQAQVSQALSDLERKSGRSFGSGPVPLLVSVRSGGRFSMPGMMDTVLNLGFAQNTPELLTDWSRDRQFSLDVQRRFLQMFANVVLGVDGEHFETILETQRNAAGVKTDSELAAAQLEVVVAEFGKLIDSYRSEKLPPDPTAQLWMALEAVFRSWDSPRAQKYRELNRIEHDLGTAVNVQMMVFGDLGSNSGSGVAFTRHPGTGQRIPYGEFLPQSQGEDVVAGIRTPHSLSWLEEHFTEQHRQLTEFMSQLEGHFGDMCDIEFTIETGKLWVLQTRPGKRTAEAAVQIAVDMGNEGLINRDEALLRVDPALLEQLDRPRIDPSRCPPPLLSGVNASPGAAQGEAVFSAEAAVSAVKSGKKVVLVRPETTPDDIEGIAVAEGMLTSLGGKTSHAAVVARGMGKPAVTGAGSLKINTKAGWAKAGETTIRAGDLITIDGSDGGVYRGAVELIPPHSIPTLWELLSWADEVRQLGVYTNADTGADAKKARAHGAEGVGLARTEHMFMGSRLPIVQHLILTEDPNERAAELERLRTTQIADFEELLAAMDGLPVVIRLLDPPLHEFLPSMLELEHKMVELARAGKSTVELEELESSVARWAEDNPMLGLRGVRLGILIPDLYRIQIQAALTALANRLSEGGNPRLEIMIPLVSAFTELKLMAGWITEELERLFPDQESRPQVPVGTMIELPRAALIADRIGPYADFFSFGTNDLTQMTYGLSRDDAEGMFLGDYLEQGVLSSNPFQTIDVDGVGKLVEMATRSGRAANPQLKVGVCGEHGGDPDSIEFFHRLRLDYVSASPPRVRAARLAAAQAQLRFPTD